MREYYSCWADRNVCPTGTGSVEIVHVSNQSTGFCPEPESWPCVAAALDVAGIPHPGEFTAAIIFRRCPACDAINIVKDGWFECAVCGGALPKDWNVGG